MKKTGIQLIAEERKAQIEKHGYSVDKDVNYNKYQQLSEAASLLCVAPRHVRDNEDIKEFDIHPFQWGEDQFKKMMSKPYHERLIIAGALIAAELDRLENM